MYIAGASPLIGPREGFALPAAIFGMVVISLITAGAMTLTDLDSKATTNRVDAATAQRLAHTAETHAIAVLRTRMKDTTFNRILRGADNVQSTSDDGLLDGYATLGDSLDIPATGRATAGGTYYVKITDDPRETDLLPFADSNKRLLITCRGVTASGSQAEINVIVGNFALPAIVVDGTLEMSSIVTVGGLCGGVHANGKVRGSGTATATTSVSATSTVTLNVIGTKLAYQAPIEIPDLNPADFCGAAGYVHIGTGSPAYSSGTWKPTSSNIQAGKTYCVTGNVEFAGDVTLRSASIIASGSIKLGGKKVWLTAAHPDGIVLMAGGDLDMQGLAGFTGFIYAGGQAYISGGPTLNGQYLVKNKQPHPGTNYFDQWDDGQGMLISGAATFSFDCNSMLSSRFGVVSWYPTIGS